MPGRNELRSAWLPELDGLRGLAAITVVIAHYSGPGSSGGAPLAVFLSSLARFSAPNLAVAFFFTLSSFLLTYLAVRERLLTGRFSVRNFYLRRIARIWPIYFFILVVGLAVASPDGPLQDWNPATPNQWDWIMANLWQFALFVSNWSLALNHVGGHVDLSIPELTILWSIAVEEQFYAVFPLLLALLAFRPRITVLALVLMSLTGIVFRAVFAFLPVDVAKLGSLGGMYYATVSYLDMFAWGALAGWLAAIPDNRLAHRLRASGGAWTPWLLAAAMTLLGAAWYEALWHPYSPLSVILYTPIAMVFALLVFWVTGNPETWISRQLRSPSLRMLGAISFGVYLWHPIILRLAVYHVHSLPVVTDAEENVKSVLLFLQYSAGTVLAAMLTHLLVERPVLRLKDRFLRPVAVSSVAYRRGAASVSFTALLAVAALELVLHVPLRFSSDPGMHAIGSPPVPQALRIEKIGAAEYTAQWHDVVGETRYQIDAATGGGRRMRVGMTGTNDTKLSFSAPAAWGGQAVLEVRSCNQFSCSNPAQILLQDH